MRWGVLGPLSVLDADGSLVTPAGPMRRILLAALLSRANHTVTPAVLAHDVWSSAPPRSAAKTLQSHVVRLRDDLGRKTLGASLVTEPTGYRLVVDESELDASLFSALAESASRHLHRGDVLEAEADLRRALQLWRGTAYEEFPDAPFLVAERIRLTELRAYAQEQQVDVDLGFGRAAELVPVLEQQVLEAPYRERRWQQLALALYRSGRQADALASCRRARDLLAADLGVDPGPELRALESRILRHDPSLVELVAQPAATVVGDAVVSGCPYRGLDGYDDDDAAVFVGRERLTARVAGSCAAHDVVIVTGASGAGKSSLVRAGLLPALRQGALPASAGWRTRVATAGHLGAELDEPDLDLLVVDQGEELFSSLDAPMRTDVVRRLLERVERGMRLVVVLRSDFYGRLVELPPLDDHAQAATVLVGPMRDDDLRRVVIEPALRVGVTVLPDAVDAVLDDAAGRPDALPMVSVALLRAWAAHDGQVLTRQDYTAGGGVAGALEAAADESFGQLDREAQTAARQLLVRLAVQESGRWVRRPLPRQHRLDAAGRRAVDALVEARLLVVDRTRVELVHDALLDGWPRLRTWLEERTLHAQLLADLTVAAGRWSAGGQIDADLYRGVRLQAAREWQAQHPDDLSIEESEFLEASAGAAEEELARERARADREATARHRLRRAVLGLALLSLVAVAVGVVAAVERSTADRAARRERLAATAADARRIAALALSAPDLRTSLLLAATAYRLQDSTETRSALLTEVQRSGSALFRIPTHERVQWVGVDSSGSTLWWADNTREVTRLDLHSRRVLTRFPIGGSDVGTLSPDGTQLVTSGQRSYDDSTGATRVSVINAATGGDRVILPTPAAATSGVRPAFTSDGRWLLVPVAGAPDGSFGSAIDVYRAGDLRHAVRRVASGGTVTGLAAGTARAALLLSDGRVELVEPRTGRVVVRRRAEQLRSTPGLVAPPIALAPDDDRLAVAPPQRPNAVTLLNLRSGATATTGDTDGEVNTLGFAPDGRRLAVGTGSGAVTVYGVNGAAVERTVGESGAVKAVAWAGSSSHTTLFTGGLDSQVVAWGLQQPDRLLRLGAEVRPGFDTGIATPKRTVTFSPPLFTVPPHDEQLVTIDAATEVIRRWPLHLQDEEQVAELSPDADGERALVTVLRPDRSIRCDVWDTSTGTVITSFVPSRTTSPHQAFGGVLSRDGRTVIANVGDRRLGVFSVADGGRRLATVAVAFAGPAAERTLATPFSIAPDGRVLVWGYDPGPQQDRTDALVTEHAQARQQVALVDLTGHRSTSAALLTPLALVDSVAWAPDGNTVVVGAGDGNVWLLDARDLRVLVGPVTVTSGSVTSLTFVGGSTVVATGDNGTLTVWDATTLAAVGAPFHPGEGSWVVTIGGRRGAMLTGLAPTAPGRQRRFTLPLDSRDWLREACAGAGPSLTRTEWRTYIGDLPYRSGC